MIERALWMTAAVLVPALALAQAPGGPEFEVNDPLAATPLYPRVGTAGNGDFVVVWNDVAHDGDGWGVIGQRFAQDGTRRGWTFVVNTYTTGRQGQPAIAVDTRGHFAVAWTGETDANPGVFHRRFGSDGTPRGGERRAPFVNFDGYDNPALSLDARGEMALVFRRSFFGDLRGIHADRAGEGATDLFAVNSSTTGQKYVPSVAAARDGSFVVAWQNNASRYGPFTVVARRFARSGEAIGAEFRVSDSTQNHFWPAVATDGDGGFVVVWIGETANFGAGLYGQRFAADGERRGGEFLVHATTSALGWPGIAADENGAFVVTWAADWNGGFHSAFARRFDASGAPRGDEFQVNAATPGAQSYPSVASDGSGNFVVVWSRFLPDGSAKVIGRRFGGLFADAMAVDTAGNGVWEPGEEVDVRPAWRNVTGAAQTVGGMLGPLTGPAGATYTITDGAAVYGTIADGGSAPCSDCYRVSVSAPATRPAAHWDAVATETLSPAEQGQVKRWPLHIGGSYTDVPAASPYYRFAETLLHRGVTAGCAAAQFCPGAPTKRAQMAVFALGAKEGPTFAPPACGTPLFADVPASDPFCPWIEELARRGIAGGCGGGNFCASAAVTREQMAVFMLRTVDPTLVPPACGTPIFADVPASSIYCRWIEELVRRGITNGCGGGNYCPTGAVTRDQMAVFTTTTFGLTLYGP